MLAYSSVSQGGFILMPLAFVGTAAPPSRGAEGRRRLPADLRGFTNLGAFAVVIAVSRKTHSGEISSFGGLISYAPGLAVLMTIFLASLAGIPPLGGWIAKFNAFRAVLDAGTTAAYVLAVIAAVNTAIAAALLPQGDARDVDEAGARRRHHADRARRRRSWPRWPSPRVGTLVLGVLPGLVMRFGDLGDLAGALRRLMVVGRACRRRHPQRHRRRRRGHPVLAVHGPRPVRAVGVLHRPAAGGPDGGATS